MSGNPIYDLAELPIETQHRICALGAAGTCAKNRFDASATAEEIRVWTTELAEIFLALLRELTFPMPDLRTIPYPAYLHTAEWKEKRLGALQRVGYRCQLCNGVGLVDVHHRTYERRGDERPEDLTVLCRRCNQIFHELSQVQKHPEG